MIKFKYTITFLFFSFNVFGQSEKIRETKETVEWLVKKFNLYGHDAHNDYYSTVSVKNKEYLSTYNLANYDYNNKILLVENWMRYRSLGSKDYRIQTHRINMSNPCLVRVTPCQDWESCNSCVELLTTDKVIKGIDYSDPQNFNKRYRLYFKQNEYNILERVKTALIYLHSLEKKYTYEKF